MRKGEERRVEVSIRINGSARFCGEAIMKMVMFADKLKWLCLLIN